VTQPALDVVLSNELGKHEKRGLSPSLFWQVNEGRVVPVDVDTHLLRYRFDRNRRWICRVIPLAGGGP
jgi:hypothetical protein